MVPFTITAKNFEKLRRWEEPYLTVSFLAFAYTIIFRYIHCLEHSYDNNPCFILCIVK